LSPKQPPLYDPYLIPIVDAPRRQLSVLAVCSVLASLFLGPVGAIGGVVMGWAARREITGKPTQRKGHTLATIGMALGLVMTAGWVAAAGVGLWVWQTQRQELAAQTQQPSIPIVVPDPSSSEPQVPASPRSDPQPAGSVPKETAVLREGALTLVTVGVSSVSLADALLKQRREAEAAGQTVVVMTTRNPCDPCRGFDAALTDQLMQSALAGVRLVRVDIDVFKDDLDQLRIQRQRYPGFFLLAPDLSPKDGIDGGEWDEDIAVNIAPVLGPFVRGKYTKRRQSFRPLPRTGVAL
jgi:hypothetical protein